jgi:hypothetical protein
VLQREGGKRLRAQEFLGGHSLKVGQKFIEGPVASRTGTDHEPR